MTSQQTAAAPAKGSVVLLHGHGRTPLSMRRFAIAAQRAGFTTFAPSYGLRQSMAVIVATLGPRITGFAAAQPGPVHFITHSLGGLVARACLARHRPDTLGRVVMSAPPNSGSELADLLLRMKLHQAILGPVGDHLATRRSAAAEAELGCVDYPLGVIAGNRHLSPWLPAALIPSPNDGKVTVAATRIAGMADHIVLPVAHTFMTHDRRVIEQAIHFLETGAFKR